jgi:hypothetical protein
MKPPALSITLDAARPGSRWHYTVREYGEAVAYSDGDGFVGAGRALQAAILEFQSLLTLRVADKREETNG